MDLSLEYKSELYTLNCVRCGGRPDGGGKIAQRVRKMIAGRDLAAAEKEIAKSGKPAPTDGRTNPCLSS